MHKLTAVGLGIAALAAASQATTIFWNGVDAGQGVTVTGPGALGTRNVWAGMLKFSTVGPAGPNFLTVCADITNFVSPSFTTSVSNSASSASPNVQAAGSLVALYFNGAIGDNDKAAGLQLAVWELLYDTTPGNLGSGSFIVNSGGGATTQAQNYLNAYASAGSPITGSVYFDATGGSGQSQFTPVPEPGTIAALGLGALALIRKRRNRK